MSAAKKQRAVIEKSQKAEIARLLNDSKLIKNELSRLVNQNARLYKELLSVKSAFAMLQTQLREYLSLRRFFGNLPLCRRLFNMCKKVVKTFCRVAK